MDSSSNTQHLIGSGREEGQAMVEAAMTILLLFVFVFGIFEGGRLIQTQQALTDAARVGARRSITPLTHTSTLPTTTNVVGYVQDALRAASLCTACDGTEGITITVNQSVVLSGMEYSEVTVSYPYRIMTASMFSSTLNITLTGQSVMREETSP
jgi:Flp pilus assembly protein TadG